MCIFSMKIKQDFIFLKIYIQTNKRMKNEYMYMNEAPTSRLTTDFLADTLPPSYDEATGVPSGVVPPLTEPSAPDHSTIIDSVFEKCNEPNCNEPNIRRNEENGAVNDDYFPQSSRETFFEKMARKKWWLILTVALVVGLVVGLSVAFSSPSPEISTTMATTTAKEPKGKSVLMLSTRNKYSPNSPMVVGFDSKSDIKITLPRRDSGRTTGR